MADVNGVVNVALAAGFRRIDWVRLALECCEHAGLRKDDRARLELRAELVDLEDAEKEGVAA